jgi:hypothetical protein
MSASINPKAVADTIAAIRQPKAAYTTQSAGYDYGFVSPADTLNALEELRQSAQSDGSWMPTVADLGANPTRSNRRSFALDMIEPGDSLYDQFDVVGFHIV